jgi:hypothetical protein
VLRLDLRVKEDRMPMTLGRVQLIGQYQEDFEGACSCRIHEISAWRIGGFVNISVLLDIQLLNSDFE